jgi:hypothetical protein
VVDTLDSTYDTVLAVWTGSWGALQPVGCDDDGGQAGAGTSQIEWTVSEGMTYYIEVAGTGADEWGVLELSASFRPGYWVYLPVIMSCP